MMENEIMVLIFCSLLTFAIGFVLGQTMSHKNAWIILEQISQWIEDTHSNQWVQHSIYQDLEVKYDALVREYEQYRGTMKAINDCRKKYDDGDIDD